MERQQRIRNLGRLRRVARLWPRAADPSFAALACATDDTRDRRSARRTSTRRKGVHGYAGGPPGHPTLRSDLVGRQLDELAHAALEFAHGTQHESLRHVQHRPRRWGIFRSGPGSGIARALGTERRLQPTLHHELVEAWRRNEYALASSTSAGADPRGDSLSLSPDAVSVHAVPPRRGAGRTDSSPALLRLRRRSARVRGLRRFHVRIAVARRERCRAGTARAAGLPA